MRAVKGDDMREDETMRLPCRLTPGEKARRADELSRVIEAHEELKADQKANAADFARRVKESERRIYDLGDVVRTESEFREVPVRYSPDFERNQMQCIRLDTGEICSSRPMEGHERQAEMDFPDGGGDSSADAH